MLNLMTTCGIPASLILQPRSTTTRFLHISLHMYVVKYLCACVTGIGRPCKYKHNKFGCQVEL